MPPLFPARRLPCLLALAALTLPTARAADLYAQFWGDALPLPSAQAQREDLNRARLWLCPSASGSDGRAAMAPVLRDLEKTLDALPKNDPALPALMQALRQMRASASAVPVSAPPRAPALTFAQAIRRAQAWLDTHEAAGVRALRASPEGRSAGRASAFALQASLAGRPEAALAGLLTAHALDPKNADTLVNLGGVLVTVGLPAEALAVLGEAQRLGIKPGGAVGVPMQAAALNSRGRALLKLGSLQASVEVLRKALTVAPTLPEANQNLARALLCQGRTEDAVHFMRVGARRAPASSAARPTGPEAPPRTPGAPPQATGREEAGRVDARRTFDMSRGQSFMLPDLRIAQTPEGMAALLDQYRQLNDELTERGIALARQEDAVAAQLRARVGDNPATEHRRRALWQAIIASGDEPDLSALDARSDQLEHEVADIWTDFWHCEGACKIAVIIEQAHGDQAVFRSLCVPQLKADHERWRNAMHAYAHDLAATLKAKYRYETALAANYSDPLWRKQAVLHTQGWVTAASSPLAHHAMLWASDIKSFEDGCLEGRAPDADTSPVSAPLQLPAPNLCQQLVGKFTTSLALGQVDASFSCDKASLKIAPSGLLSAFTKVDLDTAGEKWKTTLIVGVQGGGGLKEVLGLGVKASVGTYVSVTRDGVQDFGMVGDVKSSVSLPLGDALPIGQVKVGESAKAISVRWSFVTGDTAFDLGH